MLYIASVIMSLFTLIMTIVVMFSNSDSTVYKMFGLTETLFCMAVSIVLIIIGLILDKRE